MDNTPLAVKIRPNHISEVIGQKHILGEGKVLRKIIMSENIPNMIFFGPSGTGKTTVANIIAKKTNKKFFKLNGTNSALSDIKEMTSQLDTFLTPNGVLLYLDEIQYFNKKQQQSLLEYIENGKITLVASTTENPYFYIYNAILSRCLVFEFLPLSISDVVIGIERATGIIAKEQNKNLKLSNKQKEKIAYSSAGDLRKALNILEGLVLSEFDKDGEIVIDDEHIQQITNKMGTHYDKDGDMHYDILSAFHKSLRGSDPNASIHYLARLIEAGDLISICRRLLVAASEDVGLAYPMLPVMVKSLVDSAMQLGFPEARLPLSNAALLIAASPKSNSVYHAIDAALFDIKNGKSGQVPTFLKDTHYSGAKDLGRGTGYKYPHEYENNYVFQNYLPDELMQARYYTPGKNKNEQAIKEYWKKIKGNDK